MKGIQLENYDLKTEIKRDAEGKRTSSGLTIGDILHQNQSLILTCHKGEIKSSPTLGVGISDMLLDHDPTYWKREIRENLELDGQSVTDLRITTSSVDIEANYKTTPHRV